MQKDRLKTGSLSLVGLGFLMLLFFLLCSCARDSDPPPLKPVQIPTENAASGQERAEASGRSLIGRVAPALTIRTIDGHPIALGEYYGKRPVYLKFWATWCRTCLEQMPSFKSEFSRLGDEIEILAVNTGFNDDLESVRAMRTKLALPMPIVIDDGRLAKAFNLRVTPLHVVIGRSGRILYMGHDEDERLQRALAAAIKEPRHQEGRPEPDIGRTQVASVALDSIEALDGQPVQLSGAASDGRARVVLFLSPWCEDYLAKSRPTMAQECRAAREAVVHADRIGSMSVIGISSGLWTSEQDLRDFAKQTQFPGALVLDADGALFRRFDVGRVPTILVIDREGALAHRLEHDTPDFVSAISKSARP